MAVCGRFAAVEPATFSPSAVPPVDLAFSDSAVTNAEAGLPPRLSASAAFSAYGTETSSTRSCSLAPDICGCTPSHKLRPEVDAAELADLYARIDLPLIRVLASMETLGITVDHAQLKLLGGRRSKAHHTLQEKKYHGHTLNSINTHSQKAVT